jgi:hypothetical protein
MPGDHHPLAPALRCARDHRVAVAFDGQVGQGAQRLLDGVGERLLVAAHRFDVDDRRGEGGDVLGQIKPHAA